MPTCLIPEVCEFMTLHSKRDHVGMSKLRILPLYMEGKEKPKKGAGHSRLVGGRVNEQGNLYMRLILAR